MLILEGFLSSFRSRMRVWRKKKPEEKFKLFLTFFCARLPDDYRVEVVVNDLIGGKCADAFSTNNQGPKVLIS